MRKFILFFLVFLLFLSTLLPAKDFLKVGVFIGLLSSSDDTISKIYHSQDLIYGLRAGFHIWEGLYFWVAGSQYDMVSKTTITQEISRIRINPLHLSVRYTHHFTDWFGPYGFVGYSTIFFEENSDIGDTTGQSSGYSLGLGIEFRINPKFIIDTGVKYSSVSYSLGDEKIDLGGLQAAVSFLVVLF